MKSKKNSLFYYVLVAVIVSTCVVSGSLSAGESKAPETDYISQAYPHAKLKPIQFDEAQIDGGYLRPVIDRSIKHGVIDFLQKFEEHGYIENFRIVAKNIEREHTGYSNNNEFVYKLVEAAGYYAPVSPIIGIAFDPVIADILAAQDDNGYLNTYYDNPLNKKKNPDNRFKPMNRFEFYDFGHLTQAGIAWYRVTGRKDLLDASIRFADLICDRFSAPTPLPYKKNRQNRPHLKYEHPNHEMAMVELYRVTGNKRYLEFAQHTLEDYDFWNFEEIWGHAVQETLLQCGGADVYLEMGKPGMLEQLEKIWHDVHDRKMYITGGVGSKGYGESYGDAYELPNRTSYCETCAAISKVMWDYRMLLATGNVKYGDDMERTLYNAVLVGYDREGVRYFYQNKQEVVEAEPIQGKNVRSGWFKTACCPPNVHRFLGSLHTYLYTVDKDGIQLHLYNDSRINTETLNGQAIQLVQKTDYPRESDIHIDVQSPGEYDITLRIPGWAHDVKMSCCGERVKDVKSGTMHTLSRIWEKGDTITLTIPVKPYAVNGNPKVDDQKGKVALMRGPLVYCLEQIDNKGIDLFEMSVPAELSLTDKKASNFGGMYTIVFDALDKDSQSITCTAIPYHLWTNRGPSPMCIWLPLQEK